MPHKKESFTPINIENLSTLEPLDLTNRFIKLAEAHETTSYPCPYFNDGRIATLEVIKPTLSQILSFHTLLELGFRRTGGAFYFNDCKGCKECISIRIPLKDFKPSKSQRKTIRQNSDIQVTVSHFSERSDTDMQEKFDLFKKYMKGKHNNIDNADWMEFFSLHNGYPFTSEIHFYLKDKLIAVSVIDESKNGISSNYFYYDPDLLERRLGIFSIIKEIEYAQSRNKDFLYLGFYIENCQKMAYKKHIRPNEILDSGVWKQFLSD